MKTQRFASEYLLRRAIHKMKKLGYVVATRMEYCGLIEITWRKQL